MGTNNPIPAAAAAAEQRPDTPSQEGSHYEIDLRVRVRAPSPWAAVTAALDWARVGLEELPPAEDTKITHITLVEPDPKAEVPA